MGHGRITSEKPPEGPPSGPNFIDDVARNSDALASLGERLMRSWKEMTSSERKYELLTSLLLFAIILSIIVSTTWLVSNGRLDATTYAFVIGTIAGAVLVIFKDYLIPAAD